MVLSVGDLEVDLNRISLLAAEALQRAVIKAVQNADGFGILPSCQDIARQREDSNGGNFLQKVPPSAPFKNS